MTMDEERRFQDYFEMHATRGWKQLMADLEEQIEALNDIRSIKDERSLAYRQGQMFVLDVLVRHALVQQHLHAGATDND